MAEGSRRQLAYVVETTWGTTPATPSLKLLRNTGGAGINLARSAINSAEFRSDRAIPSMRLGAKKVDLTVPFEFSYGSFDDFLEAALFGTWATNVLKQGVTPKFFTIEEGFTDIGQYQVGTGFMVDSLSLSLKPEGIITGSFGLVGKTAGAFTGVPLDASPDAVSDTDAFDAFTGFIKESGTTMAIVTGLDFTLKNGLEGKPALFQDGNTRIGVGRANLSGSISLYFTSATMANKFINETESSLEFTFQDPLGNKYDFLIPRIKFSGSSKAFTENDVVLTMPFQALYSSTEATVLKITRTPHA